MNSLFPHITEIKGFFGDYAYLSNMYLLDISIEYNGMLYKSTENAYQSAKFDDISMKVEIQNMSPKKSKIYARKNKQFIIPNWYDIRLNIMREVVFKKFLYNIELQEMLINIGDAYIEETNNWNDIYYGVCNGVGKNHLGLILMQTRKYFSTK